MDKRKRLTIGDRPQDIRQSTERIASDLAAPPDIQEYEVTSGSNVVSHGKRALPKGRQIVWSTVGAVTDVSLDNKKWTFTAAGAGIIRVIWL